ncbi:solute carrier family 49 member 4-like isoform X2 [Mytilus trossulus]|uniref:solute carrier family 49 member 4-like isoform X2 n=1 Tax=Mytilus trossulus TaxID=6551 RepID=UPI003006E451
MEHESKPLLFDSDNTGAIYTETAAVIDDICNQNVVINTDEALPRTKVYKRRWYILVVFSLCAMSQGGSWNIYGPISATTENAFDWKDSDIALLAAWGPISSILSTLPFIWLIEKKGIRVASLLATFLVLLGAVVRCLTTDPSFVTWTSNIGQFLNGLGGPIAFGAPPVLSALWFPANERTTATALNSVLSSLGPGLAFILGPYFVPLRDCHDNKTVQKRSSIFIGSIMHNCTNQTGIKAERTDIHSYMIYYLCFVGAAFLLMLVYYPTKPKLPPTLSASVGRLDFSSGITVLLRFSDIFTRHMRLLLLLLYICSSGCFVWFIFLVEGVIYSSTFMLYASIIMGTMFLSSTLPLFFEMACEAAYPVPEGTTNLLMICGCNVSGVIFLAIQMIPNIGTKWATWCMMGCIVSCIPVLAFLKERYNRLEVDEITIDS